MGKQRVGRLSKEMGWLNLWPACQAFRQLSGFESRHISKHIERDNNRIQDKLYGRYQVGNPCALFTCRILPASPQTVDLCPNSPRDARRGASFPTPFWITKPNPATFRALKGKQIYNAQPLRYEHTVINNTTTGEKYCNSQRLKGTLP